MPSDSGPDEVDPIKRSPLKTLLREHSDKRIGSDAVDLLKLQTEDIIGVLWVRASKYAEARGLETVKEEDVQQAYDDLMAPHDLLIDAADDLDTTSERMREYAEESPINTDLS